MDRRIVMPGQIPLDADMLETNRNAMVGLSKLIEAIFGTTTLLSGFACTPTAPATLNVKVAAGQILSLQNLDATAYGSLPADLAHQIVKQGLILDETTLNCPAPGTVGFSINYLVQIAFSETDVEPTLRTYLNASNPAEPFLGANNNGIPDATRRKAAAVVQVKAGVAATTGTQTTPAPDAGFIAAWVVTVDNGQTEIQAADIAAASGAPFVTETLQAKLSQGSADVRYLQKSGGVMTGAITLAGAPINPDEPATKAYVDGLAGGIHALALGNVAVATTANITLSGEQTIDGVLTSASRVLVKNQAAPAQNGAYVSAAGAWARSTDADTWTEAVGALALVTAGTTQAGSAWLSSGVVGGALGTDAINWGPFFNAASFQAANALLTAIAGLGANGIVVRTGAGSAAARSIAGGAGIVVTNGDGVAGNPTVAADKADVTAARAGTVNKLLDAKTPFDAAASVNLPASGAITFDMATMFNGKMTLTGNVTFNAPTNVRDSQHFKIELKQDAFGSRTASFHANWKFTGSIDPVLTTTPGALDIIYGCGLSDGTVHASLNKLVG